jgi:transcriptional regulator with XRE-family HTH domain
MPRQASTQVKRHGGSVAGDTIALIGQRLRGFRRARGMSLQELAEATGVSVSMLSLVERGKASPSIGTLIAISAALEIHMSDLLTPAHLVPVDPVSRSAEQAVFRTREGVERRLLSDDRLNGVEIAVNKYEPKTGSAPVPVHHEGFEYGVVLDGELTVELDGKTHTLKAGDLISYDSARRHRIWNYSGRKARALWINLRRP